ncbi:transglutaminase domain-containing protein [Actinosynnema sp. CS-041913]|uniref:transglutaminase domain-containing protein n=1 Tax=Actinosynnema sp. CS-041913 TaxID=3239917 RepID=UPI003D8C7B03
MTTLDATYHLDHDSPEVQGFLDRHLPDRTVPAAAAAVTLYYAVRDGVRYEVYGADLSRAGLTASAVAAAGSGMCLHKSVLYAALLRAVGVPSKLVLTDVRNHLTSDRLRELVGGDVFHYHCLTSVHIGHKWVRATPVFNRLLCKLYRIAPLEFDGTADSVHHPYDLAGRRNMEFLREHGEFEDLPYDLVIDGFRTAHPNLLTAGDRVARGSLVVESPLNRRP